MRTFLLLIALLVASPAAAADRADAAQVHAAVAMLVEEQRAVFQQFQMVQELRRATEFAYYASQFGSGNYSTGATDYFGVADEREALARRSGALLDEAAALYRRYQDIGERKQALQQRILELAR